VQMRAEIPIVQADTIYQGFGGGSVSGIVFGPTGETVILMHDAQPVEINIKTKQIVREFEKVPNNIGSGNSLIFIKDKNHFTAYVTSSELFGMKDFGGNVIWDYITGKIIKALQDVYLITDGIKYYSRCYSDNYTKEYIGLYDLNTYKYIDSIYLPKTTDGAMYAQWGAIGIIPNSNKVLIGANRYNEFTQGQKEYLLSEIYLLDFDTKKFTKINIPYESGQKSSEIYQIKVSESGKYCIAEIDLPSAGTEFFFYDQNLNYLYKLTKQDFINMTDILSVSINTIITTIEDDYLVFSISNDYLKRNRMAFYDIPNRIITKYLGFIGNGVYDKYCKKIGLYATILGLTGVFDLYTLPVKDISKIISPELVYSNNQLTYYSEKAFIGEPQIYDTTGKLILTLGTQPFVIGKNVININIPLNVGFYLLTIKDGTNQISYKFIVE
jgi:hypothetical protein